MSLLRGMFLGGCVVIFLSGCQLPAKVQPIPVTPGTIPSSSPTFTPSRLPAATHTPTPLPSVLVGAGDISICGQKGDDQTAALLANIPGTVFTLGDNSNEDGTSFEYLNCFDPSWGQFMDRLYPVPGNHDYVTDNAGPYFDYFSGGLVTPGRGYYSYDLGNWHIIALNSVIDIREDSTQVRWLKEDLAAHPSRCSLAYWHHPRWTSGESGDNGRLAAIWQILYENGVDVVVNGNEHMYERFAPMDPNGDLDLVHGMREFVAGTGGVSHYRFTQTHPNSQLRDNSSFGVIKFVLDLDGYSWEFIPVEGMNFTDTGSDVCH